MLRVLALCTMLSLRALLDSQRAGPSQFCAGLGIAVPHPERSIRLLAGVLPRSALDLKLVLEGDYGVSFLRLR